MEASNARKTIEGAVIVVAVAALLALGDFVAHLTGLPPFVGQIVGGAFTALAAWLRRSPWAPTVAEAQQQLQDAKVAEAKADAKTVAALVGPPR
jgi:hypothetical protein